jgi:hypothetical protein
MLPALRTAEHDEARIGNVIETLVGTLGLDDAARNTLLASGHQTVFANRL